MYPDVFQWGPLHVRSYGLLLAIAFLVGTWLALKEARRLRLDPDDVVTVILVTLVSSVLGARLLYVLEHLDEFQREWGSVLAVWQGGLTLYGGVIAGTVAGLVTARKLKLPHWRVADALAPSVALGTAFGRVGCFLNGCCYGHPTTLPWGVVYPPDSFPGLEFGATPIHPAQLYNAVFGLGLFAVLWATRRRFTTPGVAFWTFIVAFALGRIVLDFFRAYEPRASVIAIGAIRLAESQLLSAAMAAFGLLMIARLRRRAARGGASPTAAPPVPAASSATTTTPVSGAP
jgi:phosphatidylglycerol---prolipoprotein diacylglyceryl transferase